MTETYTRTALDGEFRMEWHYCNECDADRLATCDDERHDQTAASWWTCNHCGAYILCTECGREYSHGHTHEGDE